jgi:hypothetical protein
MGWLLAGLLGGFLWFNSQATPHKAAELAEKSLRQQYPGAQVDVDIEGKRGPDVLNGRFKSVKVNMSRIKLDDLPFTAGEAKNVGRSELIEISLKDFDWEGMRLDSADFHFEGVEYDLPALKKTGQFRIVHCGPSSAKLKLNELALQQMLGGKLKDVPNAKLILEDGRFHIVGEKDVFGVKVPFEMFAVPAGQGRDIVLQNPSVTVGGLALPEVAVDALMKDVNPVFVFDRHNKWPFEVQLTSVIARDGKLEINGNLPFKGVAPAS